MTFVTGDEVGVGVAVRVADGVGVTVGAEVGTVDCVGVGAEGVVGLGDGFTLCVLGLDGLMEAVLRVFVPDSHPDPMMVAIAANTSDLFFNPGVTLIYVAPSYVCEHNFLRK